MVHDAGGANGVDVCVSVSVSEIFTGGTRVGGAGGVVRVGVRRSTTWPHTLSDVVPVSE